MEGIVLPLARKQSGSARTLLPQFSLNIDRCTGKRNSIVAEAKDKSTDHLPDRNSVNKIFKIIWNRFHCTKTEKELSLRFGSFFVRYASALPSALASHQKSLCCCHRSALIIAPHRSQTTLLPSSIACCNKWAFPL